MTSTWQLRIRYYTNCFFWNLIFHFIIFASISDSSSKKCQKKAALHKLVVPRILLNILKFTDKKITYHTQKKSLKIFTITSQTFLPLKKIEHIFMTLMNHQSIKYVSNVLLLIGVHIFFCYYNTIKLIILYKLRNKCVTQNTHNMDLR